MFSVFKQQKLLCMKVDGVILYAIHRPLTSESPKSQASGGWHWSLNRLERGEGAQVCIPVNQANIKVLNNLLTPTGRSGLEQQHSLTQSKTTAHMFQQ